MTVFNEIMRSQPGCIPCKTYAEGTPSSKLSYARYYFSVLTQILSFLYKKYVYYQKKLTTDLGQQLHIHAKADFPTSSLQERILLKK